MTTTYRSTTYDNGATSARPAGPFAGSCAACGEGLREGARFCPDCGTATTVRLKLRLGPEVDAKSPTLFIAASLLCAALALLFVPVLLGPAAVLFGYLAKRRDASVGVVYMLLGGAATVLGIVLAFILAVATAPGGVRV